MNTLRPRRHEHIAEYPQLICADIEILRAAFSLRSRRFCQLGRGASQAMGASVQQTLSNVNSFLRAASPGRCQGGQSKLDEAPDAQGHPTRSL